MRDPASWLPTPSDVRMTSSPMSTALKRARLAKMSTRCADLVVAQWLHLGSLDARRDAGLDVGLDLGSGHAHQRPVAHARRDAFHRPSVRVVGVPPPERRPRRGPRPPRRRPRGYRSAPRLSAADTSAKLTDVRDQAEATGATGAGGSFRAQKGARPRGERGLVQGLWGKPSWWGVFACQRKEPIHIIPRECCDRVKRRERLRRKGCHSLQGGRGPWVGSDPRPRRWPKAGEPGRFGGGRPPALRPWSARGRGEPRR